MKNRETWNDALSNVDDRYIMAAMQPPSPARRTWARLGAVAACLILLIGAYFPIRHFLGGTVPPDVDPYDPIDPDDPDDPIKPDDDPVDVGPKDPIDLGFGAHDPSAPPRPWDDALQLSGQAEDAAVAPGQKIVLYVQVGVKGDYLGTGDLRLTVKAPDFDVSVEGYLCEDGVVTIEDAVSTDASAEQVISLRITLTPSYEESYAMGTISLSVAFVSDDVGALKDKIAASDVPEHYYDWQAIFFEGDALRLGSTAVDYAADKVELILDTKPMGAVDTWEIMIARHYTEGKITVEEFANMYYHWAYRDRIFASISSYMNATHTMQFAYMSQRIRYAPKEYVEDAQMWALYEKVQAFDMGSWEDRQSAEAEAARRELAEYILLYMKEQGIITPEEYESERALMAATKNVGNWSVGYDQNIAPYARKIEKYMYTH